MGSTHMSGKKEPEAAASAAPAPPAGRRLVIHLNVPNTLYIGDCVDGLEHNKQISTADGILKRLFCSTRTFGTVNAETQEWVAVFTVFNQTATDEPSEDLISYTDYLDRAFPVDSGVSGENAGIQEEKIRDFFKSGQPGAKYKSSFEGTFVKPITLPKPVGKAFQVDKNIVLDDREVAYDASKGAVNNLVRLGRFQIVLGFFLLLQTLIKAKREFCVVVHAFSEQTLNQVLEELNAFAEGNHPCFNGQNKTKKACYNGTVKGAPDLRITPAEIGKVKRAGSGESGSVSFSFGNGDLTVKDPASIYATVVHKLAVGRPLGGAEPPEETDEAALVTAAEEAKAELGENASPGELEDAERNVKLQPPPGMMAVLGVLQDFDYWNMRGCSESNSKVFVVDSGDTEIQQIYFDGCEGSVCPVEAVRNAPVTSVEELEAGGMYVPVSTEELVTDPQYFLTKVAECEVKFEERLQKQRTAARKAKESKEVGGGLEELLGGVVEKTHTRDGSKLLADLDTKEYLYETVLPALMPALQQCTRYRPEDPLEFIAFHLMRHGNGYNKTLFN